MLCILNPQLAQAVDMPLYHHFHSRIWLQATARLDEP